MQGFTRNIPVTSSIIATNYTDILSDLSSETTLYSTTIPAGKMKANGNYIESIYYMYSRPGIAGEKDIRAYFAGQQILDTTNGKRGNYGDKSSDGQFCLKIEIMRSTSSIAKTSCLLSSRKQTRYIVTQVLNGIDFTAPLVLYVSGQGDTSAGITAVMNRVLFYD